MLIALFIGDHAQDDWLTRLGWWATYRVQKGDNKNVTHVEAILGQAADGSVAIGSASLRDGGGVRVKVGVFLDPTHWRIVDVPAWNVTDAPAWFAEHDGEPYDWRGAWASVMPGRGQQWHWFCNQAVGAAAGLQQPHTFNPAQFATIALSFGRDVTAEFFSGAAHKENHG